MEDTIGARCRIFRHLAEMSQMDLMIVSGVHRVTISRIESGLQIPNQATIKALATAMSVPPGALDGSQIYEPEKWVT